MNWFTAIVVYLLTWWTVLFAVLPWGLKRDKEGRPENPRLKFKIIITTLLSAGIWAIIYFLVETDVISFREMAAEMDQNR